MSLQKCRLTCGESSVILMADISYTGTQAGGSRNIETSRVEIGGHTLDGEWDGDGRHYTAVDVPAEHPLAAAIRLIAESQKARVEYAEMSTSAPGGWTHHDWDNARRDARSRMLQAESRVQSDPTAKALLPDYVAIARANREAAT